MEVNAFSAFPYRRNFLLDLDFPRVVHRRGDGLADHAKAVFGDERRCPPAFRRMQFAKRAGQQPRIVFRFATHVPHLFCLEPQKTTKHGRKPQLSHMLMEIIVGISAGCPKAEMLENETVRN